MRRIRHFLVTITCVLSAFAIGRAQNACDLLSRSEIGRIAGTAVLDARPLVNTETASVCVFDIRGGGKIWMLARQDRRGNWIAEQTRRMSGEAGAGRMRPVDGLGDRAFLLGLGPASAALCVFRGGQFLQVSAMRMEDAPGIAERIARRLLHLEPVISSNSLSPTTL